MEYLQAVDIFGTPVSNFITFRQRRNVKTTCGALASIAFLIFAGISFVILCGTMAGSGSFIQ